MKQLVLLCLLARAAAAEELVLTDEAQKLRIVFVARSQGAPTYWGRWQGLAGSRPTGIAVFERTESAGGERFTPVAAGAPFTVTSDGKKVLVRGSTLPGYELWAGQRKPTTLVLSLDAAAGADELARAYRVEHGLPAAALTRTQVQQQLDDGQRQLTTKCGGGPKLIVDQAGFDQAKQAALPVVARTLLLAAAELCADADYREALKKLSGVRLEYLASPESHGLVVELRNGALVIRVNEDVANPAAQLSSWLKEKL